MNEKNKPNFIIIGAAKSGTTTLYQYLLNHPDIFITTPKEPEFFAREDVFVNGDKWYENLYRDAKPEMMKGEASTIYSLPTLYPDTIPRMHTSNPDLKLIFLIREPVSRSYSYYTQLVKNYQNATKDYRINRTFEECIFPELHPNRAIRSEFFAPFDNHLMDKPELFIDGSKYNTILSKYIEYFNIDNILVITFDKFISEMHNQSRKVCEFIGVDPDKLPDEIVNANISSQQFKQQNDMIMRGKIGKKLAKIPLFNFGRKILPLEAKNKLIKPIKKLFSIETNHIVFEKIKPETNEYLRGIFQKEVNQVQDLVDIDLKDWNYGHKNS